MQTGRVYKLTSEHTDKIYIGSTTKPLDKRFYVHTKYYEYHLLRNNFDKMTAFELLCFPDCKIELLEEIQFDNKELLLQKEGEYIKQYINVCVNKNRAGRTKEVYYIDNLNNFKSYYLRNKERIANYYQANKEQKKQYQRMYERNKRLIQAH